jgi:flagellar assembly protein FliH
MTSSLSKVLTTVASEAPAASWVWGDLSDRSLGSHPGSSQPSPAMEEARAEGYSEGVRDGLEQGKAEAMESLESAIRALGEAASQLHTRQAEWASAREENVAALGTALARVLLEDELEERPEAFASRVRAALASFPAEETLRIRIHPRDLSSIAQFRPGDVPITGSRAVQWMPDDQVGKGGVIVEGPTRIVDGRVEPALTRIYRSLIDG